MSSQEFRSWASSRDPAVELEDARDKAEELGLKSFERNDILKDLMDQNNVKGGFIYIDGQPEKVGYVGETEAVSEAIGEFERQNRDEVAEDLSRLKDALGVMNDLHDMYREGEGSPYGDLNHSDVEEFGDSVVEILLRNGEDVLGMDHGQVPEVEYKEGDSFTGGHGRISYSEGEVKSEVEDLEDIFELDLPKAIPTPLELFHEASHVAAEELARRQYEQEGNDEELGNYVSGYLDGNGEEFANELMMYTWRNADEYERDQIAGEASNQVFEEGLEAYLDITKHSTPEYRDQHPIQGTSGSVEELYAT